MQIVLQNKGLYMVTMGRELKPHKPLDKTKYLNKLDEAFGFMCIHISRKLLFHLDGLKYRKEVWEKLESLFGNIRGNLGSKMGLIRKRANNKFCELEFKNQ